MGIFGWDLPPGCSYNDLPGNQPDPPCDVCGGDPCDCLCPECPVCGSYGDPKCYEEHGLVRTQEQIDSKVVLDLQIEIDSKADSEFWDQFEKEELERSKNEYL